MKLGAFEAARRRRSALRGRGARRARPRRPARAVDRRHPAAARLSRRRSRALLGEAAVLTVLLGTSLKFEGRFQLQTKTDGPVEMIVVDFDAPDRLRATARFDADARRRARPPAPRRDRRAPRPGILAMTIDQGSERSRYQGVVRARGPGLRGGGAPVFPPVGADPDARAPRRRRGVRRAGGAGATGGPAASWCSSCRRRPSACASRDLPPGDVPGGPSLARAPSRRRGRRLGRGAGARRHGRGPRAHRSGARERAPALPPLPRARRARLRAAVGARGLPLLARAHHGDDAPTSAARTAATWSATTAASASPASSARASTTSTRPRSRPRWRSPRPHRLRRRGFVAGVAHLRPGKRA